MNEVPQWIYATPCRNQELETVLIEVEKALGFKLFVWQKTFIERGMFRRYGATTAEILRDLLQVNEPPLDYSMPPRNRMEDFYRRELLDIKDRLNEAGIHTRKVVTHKRKLGEK